MRSVCDDFDVLTIDRASGDECILDFDSLLLNP